MPRPPRPVLERYHVLIADDHPDTRDLVRQLLEHAGAIVSEAASPEQAFEIAVSVTGGVHVVVTRARMASWSRATRRSLPGSRT